MPELAQPLWLVAGAASVLLVLATAWLRRDRAPRMLAAAALRSLALLLLAVALAGPLAGGGERRAEVVFALDVSRSIDRESVTQALEIVNRARESDAHVGLVVFGADAAVESLVRRTAGPVREITAAVERSGTDIGRAIEAAVGAFGEGSTRRIVLMSDGRENRGDARAAAGIARSLGVEVHAMALAGADPGSEVHVQALRAPTQVRLHEPFDVEVVVHATAQVRAQLVLMRNGALVHESEVALQPGENVHSFAQQAARAGLLEYEAIVNADADAEPENNRYQAFVRVAGPPRVLHALGDPAAGRYVTAALEAQGIAVDEARGADLPASLHELAGYELVILNDVSGFELSLAKMELLERYVRDAGGGVIKIGGPRSYAAGGYYGTPVERLLPVDMNVRTEVAIPSLSVVFVLDRSGSMGTKVQDEDKLAIAKRAALASIDLLNRLDRVGILAFDSGREWVVPPTEAAMRGPIAEKLRALEVGGGTDLHAALEDAHRVIRKERAKVKHLIVLSDGITEGEKNFDRLGSRIAADGITLSAVALGADADRALMQRLSELGNGRYYHTEDPANVPRIFTSEALTISRDLVVEGEIRPRRVAAGEVIEGLAQAGFPPLGGYQRTYPKDSAQVLLAGPDDDPLLVTWRYGLGRAVAFTSDLSGRWGRHWVQWPEFGRFVAQTARWTMRRSPAGSFRPQFEWHAGGARMSVDVLDRDQRFVNGLELEAALIDPSRETRRLKLEQVAPGRYGVEFPAPRPGRYYVTLSGSGAGTALAPQTFGLAVPYSTEYLDLGVDRTLLEDIAAIGGGRLQPLDTEALEALTAPAARATGRRSQVWWPLLVAALALLLVEIAVRKLPLPAAWPARSAQRQRQVAGERPPSR